MLVFQKFGSYTPDLACIQSGFFSLSECLSNILMTGEFNLDERSGQLNRGAYILKLLVTKLVLQGCHGNPGNPSFEVHSRFSAPDSLGNRIQHSPIPEAIFLTVFLFVRNFTKNLEAPIFSGCFQSLSCYFVISNQEPSINDISSEGEGGGTP